MTGRISKKLTRVGLTMAVAFGTLGTLGAAPALAETLIATEVNAIDTSTWTPPTPPAVFPQPPIDPSGIAFIGPNLLVTDMNGAITNNAWDYQVTPPLATIKLLGPSGLLEPTGVDYDQLNDRLFVSSDALNNNSIYVINNWSTAPAVVPTNVESFSGDTEDPAFDPATNTLYFLDGSTELIRKMAINPTTGAVTLDTAFFIDLSALSPEADGDWEGMTWNAAQGTLVVAPNNQSDLLYEIPTTAGLVLAPNNIINAAGGTGFLSRISGLGMGPTTGGGGNSYWMADRESGGIFEFTTNALVATAPIAYNRTITVPFNTTVSADMLATDSNNNTLTYHIVSGPTSGTLNSLADGGAARTYTPANGFVGTASYTFNASDGGLTSNTATITLQVLAFNTAPVLAAIATPQTVDELNLVTFQAAATDPEANPLTFTLVNAPAGATITSTGVFNWRPSEEQGPGGYDITVRVTDSGGLFDEQVVRINVNEVSDGGGGPGPGPGGGGTAPFAAVQTSSGIWKLYHGPSQISSFFYGNPGDHAFMGDWDCDGTKTPGLYRRSDGYVYLRNSNTQGVADVAFFFGNPGDLPMAGDFDKNGCDTVSIYRPSEGRFYIMNHLGAGDAGLGAADFAYYFGNPGDSPFMGDWDGDGIDTPGLRRNSDGFVYLRNSNTQGNGEQVYFYGDSGDVVFTGDWDRDGDDTLGLYRPTTGNVYLRNTNSTGIADATIQVGGGMQAVGGKF